MIPELPSFYAKLFKWFCESAIYEELQGDLEEAFLENVEIHGLSIAQKRYKREVLHMIRPSVLKHVHFFNRRIMSLPKNYLKTSIRAIKLHPFYVFANVFGLALALSICTVGYFNYRFNATFNTYFENAEQLYKIHGLRTGESTLGRSALPIAPILTTAGIPSTRYTVSTLSIKKGNYLFNSRIAFVDPNFLDHFPFDGLDGNPIAMPVENEIAISEKLAMRLYNESYPIGKMVKMVFPNKKEESFVISEVFEELPTNTSFLQEAILPLSIHLDVYDLNEGNWGVEVDGTFVLAKQNELDRINRELSSLLSVRNKSNPSTIISSFRLDNILAWPAFEGDLYESRFRNHLHNSSVLGIAGSAFTILLLACFNFINTSIALSGKRLKEIGVRKVLGGTKKSTATQFLIENSFMILLAVLLSFGISYLLIPTYNTLFQRELIQLDKIPIADILTFSLWIIVIVAVLAAAYPSLYVSRFSALKIFRDKVTLAGKNRIMAILLTFQFALCFYNLFGLFLLVDNSYYQNTLDRGYDIDQVVNVPLYRPEQYELFKNQVEQKSFVSLVAGTRQLVGFSNETSIIQHAGIKHSVSIVQAGEGYPEVLGLRLHKGRFFQSSNSAQKEVIVNQMLTGQFGDELLEQHIIIDSIRYKVVGVVEDFNLRPIMMNNLITPTVITNEPKNRISSLTARVSGSSLEANRALEKLWYEVYPDELYKGFAQSDVTNNIKNLNEIMLTINLFLAVITILVSILGLYTLISLKAQRKSKEFGVRKVLGASKTTIIHLLGKELYWMMGIASIIGLLASMMVFQTVFDIIYAYHIDPDYTHFLKALTVVLLIVVSTIGYKVVQTSNINPSQQLRTE